MTSSNSAVTVELLNAKLDVLLERTANCERRFMNITNAAAYTDISRKSIRRLLAASKLTALRPVRGRIVIDRRELDALVLSATHQPRVGRGRSQGSSRLIE